jgi:predicted transcriptional regulator
MNESVSSKTLAELAAEIVSAYVSKNSIPPSDLPSLISSVHAALSRATPVGVPQAQLKQPEAPAVPPVPIKKSVTPDHIICLEDGKAFQSLKRHLGKLGFTPEKYREKWGLPSDYPMVAANYTKRRSEIAKGMGLGRIRTENEVSEVEVTDERKPARTRRAKEAA